MPVHAGPTDTDAGERQERLAILARAPEALLETAWRDFPDKPDVTAVRPPETGLLMARGRAGGTGQQFNMGEVPVTRAVMSLPDGTMGYGYVLGQCPRHAELAAYFDAVAAQGSRAAEVRRRVLEPAARRI
ncbi:MAG: phosphonate C-P lyase system protein PhnG, partial [Ectothiorhodospiraceae bacterium]